MKIYLTIQARSISKRFPYKCLVPIKGIPSIKLLYKRVCSKLYSTTVLTSKDESDDLLTRYLKMNRINCYRGSFNNVRKRYFDFLNLNKAKDDDIIISLTADNLFVDKYLIKKVLKDFYTKKLNFINIDQKKSGLPYGCDVSIFKFGYFKSIRPNKKSDFQKITQPMIVKNKSFYLEKSHNNDFLNWNVSMNNIHQYKFINDVFLRNKVLVKYHDLLKFLNNYKIKDNFNNKIIVGGAQFGYNYGKVNTSNFDLKKTKLFLTAANDLRLNRIDTAATYKKSETRIGNYLLTSKNKTQIFTKLAIIKESVHKDEIYKQIKRSITISKKKLNKKEIVILTHQIFKSNNFLVKVLRALSKLHKERFIIDYGVSLYDLSQIKYIIENKGIKYIEAPINILDSKFTNKKLLKQLKKKRIKLIARSLLVQGSLIYGYPNNIKKRFSNEIQNVFKDLDLLIRKYNRINRLDLILNYINSIKGINKLVIGANKIEELVLNLFYLSQKKFKISEINQIKSMFINVSSELKNPIYWNS